MSLEHFSATAKPPLAERHPQEFSLHGDTRIDPYFWLREEDNPRVIDYLQAENAYTDSYMQDTVPLQDSLFAELSGYLVETDQSVPRFKHGYWYYSRVAKGQNYRVYCRRQGEMEAPEQVLLDLNALAAEREYLKLGVFEISPDQRYLAYSLDENGAEAYRLRIKDLSSGQDLPDTLEDTYYGAAWAADSRTLFYSVIDEAHRPHKILRHLLGSPAASDALVWHEPDERFNADVRLSADERYLLISLESNTTSEQHYLPADRPETLPVMIQARHQQLEYDAEPWGDSLLIHTNDGATNFRLMRAPLATPQREHWQPLVDEHADAKLESVGVFADYATLTWRMDARLQVEALDLRSGERWPIAFPEDVASIWPAGEQDYAGNTLRVGYSSLVTPPSVYDYALPSRELSLKKQDRIAGYEPADYVSERLYASAADGEQVPITLVRRKDLDPNRPHPLYLYSYGSYGISTDPDFYASAIALLRRGFVYAIAHIRGGEEKGRRWYDAGKLLNKRNTFTDFIAAAEALIAAGYTSPRQLVIEGGSAGGLLMGAVTNLRPDLFHSVVADVPFVDVINTMLDPSLPLTVIEYEEWGNPNDPVYYDYMKSYSPYDNLAAKDYPHMLVIGGLNDPRVKYWEPAKLVARLRTLKTDANVLLLKMHMHAGHSGASGRYDSLKETAFKFAFFLKTLGLA